MPFQLLILYSQFFILNSESLNLLLFWMWNLCLWFSFFLHLKLFIFLSELLIFHFERNGLWIFCFRNHILVLFALLNRFFQFLIFSFEFFFWQTKLVLQIFFLLCDLLYLFFYSVVFNWKFLVLFLQIFIFFFKLQGKLTLLFFILLKYRLLRFLLWF